MTTNERKDKTGRIAEVELGLSAHENSALAECRAAVSNDADLDDLRDATLARYLRHNSWSVAPAVKQMKEYLAWRKANKVDDILNDASFPSFATIRTVIPYAYHGDDKDGRPIYIEKSGEIATAALADPAIVPPEHLLHSHIYGVELMQRRMYENSLKTGKRVNGITTILDFEGLGFHHRQCLHVLKTLMDFDNQYYPEYLGKLYIINCPWVGPYLYSAVSVFLSDVIKQRLQIISDNPSEFLLSVIAPDQLPERYGGNCTGARCNHGGVGGNMPELKGCIDVLDSSKLKPAGAPDDSGLESQEISYDFEKEVTAENEGDVFTWYFEIGGDKTYDVDFSVELLPVSGKKESDVGKKVFIQKVQRLKTHKGNFKAPYAGAKLLFRWDNNFSWMAGKSLKYNVEAQKATNELNQLVSAGASSGAGASASAAAAAQ